MPMVYTLTAMIAFLIYMIQPSEAKISTNCRRWSCQVGIGGNSTGESRFCAKGQTSVNVTVGVEECQPKSYLCDANVAFTTNVTCSNFKVLPWKKDLPAGDSCTIDDECYTKKCNNTASNTKTCAGVGIGAACLNDKECYPGQYCNSASKKCMDVSKIGAACNETVRCEFGSACANHICARFGNFSEGTQFNVTDKELYDPAVPDVQVWMHRLCNTFFAFKTDKTQEKTNFPIYECSKGPEKLFTKYEKTIGDTEECEFRYTTKAGKDVTVIETATCGYNDDQNWYCPSRRGSVEYDTHNKADRDLWNAPNVKCHHRSTIQYCRDIEDNAIYSIAFRSALRTEFITTGNNYPKIYHNDRCVADTVATAKNYWRIIDSAYGTVLTYFVLVAGFFTVTLLS